MNLWTDDRSRLTRHDGCPKRCGKSQHLDESFPNVDQGRSDNGFFNRKKIRLTCGHIRFFLIITGQRRLRSMRSAFDHTRYQWHTDQSNNGQPLDKKPLLISIHLYKNQTAARPLLSTSEHSPSMTLCSQYIGGKLPWLCSDFPNHHLLVSSDTLSLIGSFDAKEIEVWRLTQSALPATWF